MKNHNINAAGTALVCTAPAEANCRRRPDCDAEAWHFDTGCSDHDGQHPANPGGKCWAVEYINAAGELNETFEDYEDPPPVRPGAPVDVEYVGHDEGCYWAYVEPNPGGTE